VTESHPDFESAPDAFPVKLDQFEGPLDLLLHLIKKNEVSIHDIPIALITSQYLEAIALLQELNLDVAGEFLVMAATLIHIKSKMLLPRPETAAGVEGEQEDPRDALVRRLLVETAWHYQHRPGIGVALGQRRKGQPTRVIAIADKAQQRLCRRFRKLAAEHKPAPKIAVAIARELAGFLWAALQPEPAR